MNAFNRSHDNFMNQRRRTAQMRDATGRSISSKPLDGNSPSSDAPDASSDRLDALAWWAKGYEWAGLGQHLEAITCYDRALESDPEESDLWRNKAICLDALGRHGKAIACCDKVLDINWRDIETWANKGLIEAQMLKFEDAAASLRKAIELAPPDHPDLGMANWSLQKIERMLDD